MKMEVKDLVIAICEELEEQKRRNEMQITVIESYQDEIKTLNNKIAELSKTIQEMEEDF